MAKWSGTIGYSSGFKEDAPGVFVDDIVEKHHRGDVTKNYKRSTASDKVNDDITLSNTISIVADPYAMNNFHSIRYVTFMGAKWKVTDVEVAYPRLNLTLGGVWNGQ